MRARSIQRTSRRAWPALVLAGSLPLAGSQAPPPAERQFRAWLAAFNRGNRAELQGFLDKEFPARGAGDNQQFRPVPEAGGLHHLVARHSGKCVEAPAVASGETAPLEQRACNGSAAQSFQLIASPKGPATAASGIANGGSFRLVNKQTGRCVDAAAAKPATGAAVQQANCTEGGSQLWQLLATGGGHYKIQAAADKTVGWDVTGGPEAKADGVKLQLWRNVDDVDSLLGFRDRTGGFELTKAEEATATRFTALMKERDSDQYARFVLEVEPEEPHLVASLTGRPVPAPPELAPARLSEAELVASLRAQLETAAAADRFAGAVILAKHGKTVFSSAHGLADRENKLPNTLHTRFRIGSMNKMFTGTAALQLVQAGKLALDDPVGKHLPDYPNQDVAQKVTIHHLLTHTGGTGDIFGPQFDAHRLELRALQDYVKLYGARAPDFEPGSRIRYSNYGMLLAGVIIEKVSGTSYYDYVRDNIFQPAGMTGSGSQPEDQAVPDRSIGYTRQAGAWVPNTSTLPYRGTPAGGGYSTVEDLVRFAAALQANALLDARHTELLTTGKVDTGGDGKYAYGFLETPLEGMRSFGHGGGAPGMNGHLRVYPQSGYVIAVLSNLDPPAAERVSQFISARLPIARPIAGSPVAPAATRP